VSLGVLSSRNAGLGSARACILIEKGRVGATTHESSCAEPGVYWDDRRCADARSTGDASPTAQGADGNNRNDGEGAISDGVQVAQRARW